ncbi:DUF5067 domain-containing protein [Bifidobacterium choerinum]|uniref:Membrane protein n=3 Tax=Bifidobacterium TaxID=1678 RepID=A0A087AEE1_9BIFI|nr:DUF5067 domain-containing protein [Bifidobacterium choerinum]ATU20786.1 hypothetical protein BcFMB_07500 [Bifidobacterium choerinum]KFI57141.1 membrane protein [Bifidobacterium choerinum]
MAALGGGAALVLALGFLGGWQAKAMSAPPVLQAAPAETIDVRGAAGDGEVEEASTQTSATTKRPTIESVTAVHATDDAQGRATVLLTVEWENTTAYTTGLVPTFTVSQHGIVLEQAAYGEERPAGFEDASRFRKVLPGTKTSIQLAYVLLDAAAPVLLQVTDGTPNTFGSEIALEMR